MAKLNFEQKRQKVREIEAQIQKLEADLKEILDPQKEEKTAIPLPDGFSVAEKVFEAIHENASGTQKASIIKRINEKYSVELSGQQVQSALSYLISRDRIEIIGRAEYRVKQRTQQ